MNFQDQGLPVFSHPTPTALVLGFAELSLFKGTPHAQSDDIVEQRELEGIEFLIGQDFIVAWISDEFFLPFAFSDSSSVTVLLYGF